MERNIPPGTIRIRVLASEIHNEKVFELNYTSAEQRNLFQAKILNRYIDRKIEITMIPHKGYKSTNFADIKAEAIRSNYSVVGVEALRFSIQEHRRKLKEAKTSKKCQ